MEKHIPKGLGEERVCPVAVSKKKLRRNVKKLKEEYSMKIHISLKIL